jgi:hypothetical protein
MVGHRKRRRAVDFLPILEDAAGRRVADIGVTDRTDASPVGADRIELGAIDVKTVIVEAAARGESYA